MKRGLALTALLVPVAIGGYVAFHPGTADAYAIDSAFGQPTAFVAAERYVIDKAHTSIGFEIGHMGVSTVHGRFNDKSGHVVVDPANLENSSVEVTVKTASIDTAIEPRDNHLRSADFFEVEKFPEMTFKSTAIRALPNSYVADGDLTIKGVTKKVSIWFKYYGPIDAGNGKKRIGIVAVPFTINRQDYGVAYNAKLPDGTSSVDDRVTIRLSMEAVSE
jgi:polyisoprenoid-binding protein YceI